MADYWKKGAVCIQRPQRSKRRTFTAKDCGRIVCDALSEGEDPKKVREEIRKCPLWPVDECVEEKELLRRVLEIAEEVAMAIAVTVAVLKVVRVLSYVMRRIPWTAGVFRRLENSRVIEGEFTVLREDIRQFLIRSESIK